MPTVALKGFKCTRCNHQWVPRKKQVARVCPKCKSPYWNTPRTRRVQKDRKNN